MSGHRASGEAGFALVAVLWVVTLLSAMAVAIIVEGRSEGRVLSMTTAKAQADALADAGVYEAVRRLLEPALRESLTVNGEPIRWRFADNDIAVSVQDEAGKVDLNNASEELLATLLRGAGAAPQQAAALADTVADWRDRDDLVRLNGAEAPQYHMAGLDYGPANAPFHTVEELLLVKGMNPALFDRVAPALTVYSGQIDIDPLSAPAVVLALLRQGCSSERAGSVTNRPAASVVAGPTIAQGGSFAGGQAFSIRANAEVDGARAIREAVVRLTDDLRKPYWVYEWRDGKVRDAHR
jgi:general secretion pathway protein K